MAKPMARIFLIGMLAMYSCSTHEKDRNLAMASEVSLFYETTEKQVFPYEIVIIPDTGSKFNRETYIGTFGKEIITLVKDSKGDLVFSVPNVSDGLYELIVPLETEMGTANFTVSGKP
jgi:hypothetical protein